MGGRADSRCSTCDGRSRAGYIDVLETYHLPSICVISRTKFLSVVEMTLLLPAAVTGWPKPGSEGMRSKYISVVPLFMPSILPSMVWRQVSACAGTTYLLALAVSRDFMALVKAVATATGL